MDPESALPGTPRHPIRVVARRTGLNPTLLRAWERRYGVVAPGRSDGGQRLYSDQDVERLLLLKEVTDGGRSIGTVAELSHEALKDLAAEDRAALARREAMQEPLPTASLGTGHEPPVAQALSAVEGLDPSRLERLLRREVVTLGADRFLDSLVAPLLQIIGQRWRDGLLRPAHEHVAVAVIRQTLGWILERAREGATGETLVVGILSGEEHDLGALLAATTAALQGWRVVFLGEDLPPEEVALAARSVAAAAVGISVVSPRMREQVPDQVRQLLESLPDEIPILLGGAGGPEVAERLASDRVTGVDTLEGLRTRLEELSLEAGGPKAG